MTFTRSFTVYVTAGTYHSSTPGEFPDEKTYTIDCVVNVAPPDDNQGPLVSDVTVNPNPVAVGNAVTLTANVDDSTTGGSNVVGAEFSMDGSGWTPMDASDGTFDAASEDVTASFTAPATASIYDLSVRGGDSVLNTSTGVCTMLVVYDPSGGFVTGGGWIDSAAGAYMSAPLLAGKASFGFVSKYLQGATVPTGNTEFQFKAGDLNFHSTSYDWLVVTGSNYAKFKGTGTINGAESHKFQVWAGDGDADTFRIKIWKENDGVETVVYDNGMDQAIGGGSIMIHTH